MRLNVELALRKAATLAKEQPVESVDVLSEILKKFPNNARARALLAQIDQRGKAAITGATPQTMHRLIESGRSTETLALLNAMPAVAFGCADLHMVKGRALFALGRHREAVSHLKLATQIRPDQLDVYMFGGNTAFTMGDWETAEYFFDAALRIVPLDEDLLNNYAMTLAAQRRFDAAEVAFSTAAKINPNNAKIAYNHANALRDAGQNERAIDLYQEALRLKPDYASAANNLGTVFHQLGRDAEAEAAYLQAVKIRPNYPQAHRNLSAVHKYKSGDPLVKVLDMQLAAALPERDRMYLSFARSKAHEDAADYGQAFHLLVSANAMRKRLLGYDISVDDLLFTTIRKMFAQPLASVTDSAATPRPVFVLGMMRSGTTLVEQIISSHSKVHGCGELETLGRLCLPIMERFHSEGHDTDQGDLARLRSEYLAELLRLSARGASVVTDKMPVNFRWIGFILAAFPEARIIHMKRNPVATCWSIFKHYFSSDGNGYAFDLEDVAAYWKLYTGLMEYWHALFPGQIMDVPYEALTEEPELWSRRIMDHCGLDWEEACLNFHQSNRAVRTASASQVKQKIYTGSSEAWRKYEAYLGPLVEALKS